MNGLVGVTTTLVALRSRSRCAGAVSDPAVGWRASLGCNLLSLQMDDAVARYRSASEAGNIDALMETVTPDVEVVSPISGRMVFRNHEDVRILLGAVYGSLKGLRWSETIGDGKRCVVLGEARIGAIRMTDAMVFELASDGRIRRISPHLRPWLALTLFAGLLGPKVARHPGVIRRALAGSR